MYLLCFYHSDFPSVSEALSTLGPLQVVFSLPKILLHTPFMVITQKTFPQRDLS